MILVTLRDGRLAVRDGDILLTVPYLHPAISAEDRRQIVGYVCRRQYGLAAVIAEAAADAATRHRRIDPDLADMIAEAPHRGGKRAA